MASWCCARAGGGGARCMRLGQHACPRPPLTCTSPRPAQSVSSSKNWPSHRAGSRARLCSCCTERQTEDAAWNFCLNSGRDVMKPVHHWNSSTSARRQGERVAAGSTRRPPLRAAHRSRAAACPRTGATGSPGLPQQQTAVAQGRQGGCAGRVTRGRQRRSPALAAAAAAAPWRGPLGRCGASSTAPRGRWSWAGRGPMPRRR